MKTISPQLQDDVVISVKNISKKFCRNLKRSMAYGIMDLSKSLCGIKPDSTTLRKDEFWALKDINFELRKGETLGLIGANGCGKTTMLRILNGIFPPDQGEVTIKGRIGALIAVGAGFHPHMTGRENIYLNGAILGMTRQELEKKFDTIINFAEIGEFIDAPVSAYSSGMTVRLGFSIAINADIDILLIDEILAVGDMAFQNKCYNKIGELKKNVGILVVSHSMNIISNFCSNVLVLDKGKLRFKGDTDKAIELYNNLNIHNHEEADGQMVKVQFGNDVFKIKELNFCPYEDSRIVCDRSGNFEMIIHYEALTDINDIHINNIIDVPIPYAIPYFQSSNKTYKQFLDIKKGHGILNIKFQNIPLNNMNAYMSFSISAENGTMRLLYLTRIPIVCPTKNPLATGWNYFDIDYSVKTN